MSNVETVQSIYESFGRGDVPAIIEHLAEDVRWEDWDDNSSVAAGLPWMATRVGRDAVPGFFAALDALELKGFRVVDVMEGVNQVAAEFEIEFVVRDTGKTLRDQELHLWTFDDAGRVTRLRHYTDTAKHIDAATSSQ